MFGTIRPRNGRLPTTTVAAVAGVLEKSRPEAAESAEPERLLDSDTYEGFAVRALYTALDARPEPPLPGQWPYLRGGDATHAGDDRHQDCKRDDVLDGAPSD